MTRATTLAEPLARERADGAQHGIRDLLGAAAWLRLPEAVRERFAEGSGAADYGGAFEVVGASALGRFFAWLGMLFGTPVVPRVGRDVDTRVRVRPNARGVEWIREYRWPDGARHVVRSTKVICAGTLIEKLPARLCMPLAVFEAGGVLHFVSRGYYFDLGVGLRLWLPTWFTPGVTHVEHIDLGHGWFRFTMTVTHPQLGMMFFQSGRFCAAEDPP